MGLFDSYSTGNADADSAIGGLIGGAFSKLTNKLVKVTPAGTQSPKAIASQQQTVPGSPAVASQPAPGVWASWRTWAAKPIVILGGAVAVLGLGWLLLRKRR